MAKMLHCRVCGKPIVSMRTKFENRFAKLREHRKLKHPKEHRKSTRKSIRTRKG